MFDTGNQSEEGASAQTLPLTAPALNDALSRERKAIPASNRCRRPKKVTMGYVPTSKPGVELPCLKLRGRWLREAGFAIGQKLKVEVSAGRLMIETVD